MKKKSAKLTLTLQFDMNGKHPDAFGRFCKALIDGGFIDEVKEIGQELLKEARKRNLPIAKEIDSAVK